MWSRGIVLSHENFGESDRYVHFFTRDWGTITVLAKAARKSKRRYVGGLDLFCHDEISIKGDPKEKAYLVELSVINSFANLRTSLEKLVVAGKVIGWIKKLANITLPMFGVYKLLGQTLALIEREGDEKRLEVLSLVFRMKLINLLGFKPSIEQCARCGKMVLGDCPFDIGAGGILCEKCKENRAAFELPVLSIQDRGLLSLSESCRLIDWQKVELPDRLALRLNQLITQFASYHTHVKLVV